MTADDAALERIAVLMPSCDRYASLWPLSLEAMERYWPGRPRHTVVVSNALGCERPGVQTVRVGEDRSWSDNLLVALEQVRHDYVFMALDDLVMLPGVDAAGLNRLLARAVREGWDYLRVNPLPAPPRPGPDGLGLCPPGEAYRTSTVWSLWRTEVLRGLLQPGENAWQFEKIGCARSDVHAQWWASARRHVPYLNVVTAGRADPDALARLGALGFDLSGLAFAPMNPAEYRRHRLRLLRSRGLRLVPHALRRFVLATFARPR